MSEKDVEQWADRYMYGSPKPSDRPSKEITPRRLRELADHVVQQVADCEHCEDAAMALLGYAALLERPQEATGTKCKTCYDVGSVAVFYFDRRLPNMPCPDCAPRKPEVGRVGFLLERIMTALGHLEIEAPDVEQSKAVLRTALTKADRQ